MHVLKLKNAETELKAEQIELLKSEESLKKEES